jgi:hypothetical protein
VRAKWRKKLQRRDQELRAFRLLCCRLAGVEWMTPGTTYDPSQSPLHMHCGVVAAAVQRRFGGTVRTAQLVFAGGIMDTHIWNRLPDGVEVDLTSDQYGGDGLHALPYLLRNSAPGRFNAAGKARNERFYTALRALEKGEQP